MNNVYVGARYVPKFANPVEWVQTSSYEPLTIVTYAGASYTSKTFVPANTPLTDTAFWVITGNYNAQVEQYRLEVNAAKIQLNDKIDDVDTRLTGEITEVKTDVDKLSKRKFYFVGDSYAQGHSPDGNTTPWPTIAADVLGISDYTVGAFGGAGLATVNPPEYYLPTLIANATLQNPETYTDVVVCLGRNDANSQETSHNLEGGFTALKSVVSTKFPNAILRVGFIGSDFNVTEYPGSSLRSAWLYQSLVTYSIQNNYLNGVENTLSNRALMASDGKHPNQAGQNALGRNIANAIKYGSCTNVFSASPVPITLPNGTTGALSFGEKSDNGFVTIYAPLSKGTINFTTPITHTFNMDSTILIGDNMRFKYYLPVSQGQNIFSCTAQFNFTDTTYAVGQASLFVEAVDSDKYELRLLCPIINETKNNYLTKDIASIVLMPTAATTRYWIG